MSFIEQVTELIGEHCSRDRIQKEDCPDFELTDKRWDRLNTIVEDSITEQIWRILSDSVSEVKYMEDE